MSNVTCSTSLRRQCLLAGILLTGGSISAAPLRGEERADSATFATIESGTIHEQRNDESHLRRCLARRVTADFQDVSLRDFIAHIESMFGRRVIVDRKSLEENTINIDELISVRVRQETLEHLLKDALSPLNLTCIVHEGRLMILGINKSEEILSFRSYDITDLFPVPAPLPGESLLAAGAGGPIVPDNRPGLAGEEADPMADRRFLSADSQSVVEGGEANLMIMTMTSGRWEEEEGEGGRIVEQQRGERRYLLVRQTWKTHREIERIFATMRLDRGLSAVPAAVVSRTRNARSRREPRQVAAPADYNLRALRASLQENERLVVPPAEPLTD